MNKKEIEQARQRAVESNHREPRATNASYDFALDLIVVDLQSGISLSIPRKLIQGLANADIALISKVEITPSGSGLHWEELDVDLSVPGLVDGVFGTSHWMKEMAKRRGSIGGQSRSTAKVSASRANGRKGGRPRKEALLT